MDKENNLLEDLTLTDAVTSEALLPYERPAITVIAADAALSPLMASPVGGGAGGPGHNDGDFEDGKDFSFEDEDEYIDDRNGLLPPMTPTAWKELPGFSRYIPGA